MAALGTTTIGGSMEPGSQINALIVRPSETANVTKVSAYFGNYTGFTAKVKAAIYDWVAGTLVAASDEQTITFPFSPQWVDFPLTATLAAGHDYVLCVWSDSYLDIYYATGDAGCGAFNSPTYGAWPSSASGWTTNNKSFSFYATYAAGPAPTRSIGGAVTAGGAGIAGVPVTATKSGVTRGATTDLNGNYVISGLDSGSWTVAVGTLPDYTFSPASQAVTVDTSGSNVTGVSFSAAGPPPEPVAWDPLTDDTFDDPDLVAHVISGKVKDSTGAGISGVEVFLYVGSLDSLDFPRSALTADDGLFSFHVDDGTYVLRAVSDAFAFDPLTVTVAGGDQASQDLVGAAV